MATLAASRRACFHAFTISVQTEAARAFADITELVLSGIRASGIREGLAVITSQHTTAAIAINENEPELMKDLDQFLHALAPEHQEYRHNAVPCGPLEVPNGHAHCQALLLNASASLPIAGGEPQLGRWQRVFLVELDHPRPRSVSVALIGV